MVNKEALDRIKLLEQKYAENWGRDIDYTIIPAGITQEKLVQILEIIADTGESIAAGYSKIKDKH